MQSGGLPLWIAGGGEKKTLRIAAEYAAYTNFDGTLEGFRHKSRVLADHCRDLGRDFDEITRSANYNVVIGETGNDVADRLAWLRSHLEKYLTADQVEQNMSVISSGTLVGTPEQLAERLTELERLGMTYPIFNLPEVAYDKSGLDLLVKHVIPALA